MKKLFLGVGIAVATLLSFTIQPQLTVFDVDTANSSIKWQAYKVTGQHFGSVKCASGALSMSGNKLVGGNFTIDMRTIAVGDLTGAGAEQLRQHLLSDDFFSVAKHPTANLVITQVVMIQPNKYKLKANMTIRGITREVSFTATVSSDGTTLTASAPIKVDRLNYDIKYRSGSIFDGLTDKAIYDEFDLIVNISAKRK